MQPAQQENIGPISFSLIFSAIVFRYSFLSPSNFDHIVNGLSQIVLQVGMGSNGAEITYQWQSNRTEFKVLVQSLKTREAHYF